MCAPAGFGKTTLVRDWIQVQQASQGLPARFGWLSLDSADNDPVVFLSYLLACLQSAVPGLGKTAADLLAAPQNLDLPRVLSALVNDLAFEQLPLVLVLDDYHVIHERSIHDTLAYLIDHAPPSFHLVLTTRSDPPIPIHRYRARGQMLELRLDDLRFHPHEVGELILSLAGLALPDPDIEILTGRTEGWAAGIQMAALSVRGKANPGQFIQSLAGSQRYILDYLAEEVLNSQPAPVQSFLLETSILNRFCAPLCDALIQPAPGDSQAPSSQAMLDYLERANLFLIPLDDEQRWYRYHHLFADLLRVRFQQDRPGSTPAAELHRRAAFWLDANGWTSEAIHHFLAAGDFEQAAVRIEQHSLKLLALGELHQLVAWTRLFPADLAARRPWLSIYQAWALIFIARVAEVEPLLRQAEQAMASAGLPPEERAKMQAELITIRAIARLTSGDIPGAKAQAETAQAAIPAGQLFARSVAFWTYGFACRLQGDVYQALPAFREMLALGQQMGNLWTILTASTDLGVILRTCGWLREAESVYRSALQQVNQSGASGYGFVGRLESFLANCLLEKNELEESGQLVHNSIAHNRQWENPNHVVHAYLVLGRIQAARADLAGAEQAVIQAEKSLAIGPVVPSLLAWLQTERVRLWLAQGQTARALQWRVETPLPDRLEKPSEADELIALTHARVLLAAKEAPSALAILARLETAARAAGRVSTLIEILTLTALAAGPTPAGLAALAEALALGLPQGYRRIYLDEGQPLQTLLTELSARLERSLPPSSARPDPSALNDLLSQFPHIQPEPQTAALSIPLTGREMEILSAMAAGLTNSEIGQRLYISAGTVKAHSAAIYRKLDVINRAGAISRAKDLGLI